MAMQPIDEEQSGLWQLIVPKGAILDVDYDKDDNIVKADDDSRLVELDAETAHAALKLQAMKGGKRIADLLIPTAAIFDGYHSNWELYEARHILLLSLLRQFPSSAWASKKHSDGSEMPGWFIAGMNLPGLPSPNQISFHLPDRFWRYVVGDSRDDPTKEPLIRVEDEAPEFDGHTSADVRSRFHEWLNQTSKGFIEDLRDERWANKRINRTKHIAWQDTPNPDDDEAGEARYLPKNLMTFNVKIHHELWGEKYGDDNNDYVVIPCRYDPGTEKLFTDDWDFEQPFQGVKEELGRKELGKLYGLREITEASDSKRDRLVWETSHDERAKANQYVADMFATWLKECPTVVIGHTITQVTTAFSRYHGTISLNTAEVVYHTLFKGLDPILFIDGEYVSDSSIVESEHRTPDECIQFVLRRSDHPLKAATVFAALKENGWGDLHVDARAVSKKLRRMANKGAIHRVSHGYYTNI